MPTSFSILNAHQVKDSHPSIVYYSLSQLYSVAVHRQRLSMFLDNNKKTEDSLNISTSLLFSHENYLLLINIVFPHFLVKARTMNT